MEERILQKGVTFTYYGNMAMLVERADGYKMLFDPYITNNPHIDIPLSEFYDVDAVLITHAAFDHYADAPEILRHGHARALCGFDVKEDLIRNQGIDPSRVRGIGYGASDVFGGTTVVRSVFAQHSSVLQLDGKTWTSWSPYGFIVDVAPGITYYHTGDTCIFTDMRMMRELYHPNVMVAGISGCDVQYSRQMTPREAAIAAAWVGAEVVVPSHYPPGSPDLEEFMQHMKSFAPKAVVKAEIGKPFTCYPFMVV